MIFFDDPILFVYATSFIAAVAIVVAIWGNFSDAARASAERRNAEGAGLIEDVKVAASIDRFVTPGRLFSLRLTCALIPGTLVLAILFLAGIRSRIFLPLVPVAFVVLGSFLPVVYYKHLVKRRQAQFEADILDLTTGICNALKAGMALPQALEKIAAQMKGVMREELRIVLREYRLGVDLPKSLERLSQRMPCEDMRLLVSAIRLTTDAGGSLASVLVEMTAMIRGRREFADKVKALTAEGRFEAIAMACAPIVAFCFLHLINGEMMRPLYTTGIGWLTLGGVLTLEVVGYLVIRKIVSIEV